jgi:predicted nucleotidyltransferase
MFGNHNYNLNDENSDKDYKLFVAPTFDDLYENKMFATSKVGETEDYDVHEIRKLADLFWKANINFVEMLYSNEYKFLPNDIKYNDMADNRTFFLLTQIWLMRDQLVTMNLPYFYNACKGMYFNKTGLLDKGTEGTQHLVEKYGYDTKQALHAYRVLDFIMRFADNGFTDFKQAITYTDEYERNFMLSIKHGLFTRQEYDKLVEGKFVEFQQYEELYKNQKPKEDVRQELINIVKDIVKINL